MNLLQKNTNASCSKRFETSIAFAKIHEIKESSIDIVSHQMKRIALNIDQTIFSVAKHLTLFWIIDSIYLWPVDAVR
jgi:hypothetical protein